MSKRIFFTSRTKMSLNFFSFPHSAVSYGSEAAYGSYKSLTTSRVCPGKDFFTYKSDYGHTYILIPPSSSVSTIELETTCTFSDCLVNQYLSVGTCQQCPEGSRSASGSTSITDCEACPGGTYLPHPLSHQCSVLNSYDEITSANGWRIWTPDFDTFSGWVLDVPELEFYDNLSCDGSPLDTSGVTYVESGNAGGGWGPSNAFDGFTGSAWGGRPDADDTFYVGVDFGSAREVRCVKLYTPYHHAINVRVQAFKDGVWKNAWIEENLSSVDGDVNIISMDYDSVPTPTPPTPTPPTPTPPTPTPPTPTPPTATCPSDDLNVKVSVTTDTYPGESSWFIGSTDGNIIKSDPFSNSGETYESNFCLDDSICYQFTFLDSFGDGLISPGIFSVTVDGIEVLSESGSSFISLSANFGKCTCSSDESTVAVSVTTDSYPTDTSWSVSTSESGTVVGSSFPYELQGFPYSAVMCLDSSICHTFTFNDSFGDGLISPGDFTVTVDGNVLLSDPDTSFTELEAEFCGSPTSAPVPAPTAAPVMSPTPPSPPTPTSSVCVDSPLRFKVRKNGKNISRNCTWVANRATASRCKLTGVSSMCPDTCNKCGTCSDGTLRFQLFWKGKKVTRDCTWVANRSTNARCAASGVSETCRVTCSLCF